MAGKMVIRTDRAPGPFQGAPYNQAIRVGDLVFVAGQLGISLETGELAGPAVGEQTEQVMRNLGAILDAAGSGLDRLVKTTVFLVDLGRLRRHERGLRTARRRPAAGALDGRHLAAPERRPRRDRGDRARLSRGGDAADRPRQRTRPHAPTGRRGRSWPLAVSAGAE